MQRVLFSYLFALSLAVTGVFAQIPTPTTLGACEVQCFIEGYPELAKDNGCPDDSHYIKCLCRRPTALPTVKSCITASCTDSEGLALASYLDASILCTNNATSTSPPMATGAPTGGAPPASTGNTTVVPPKLTTTPTSPTSSGKASATTASAGGVSGGMEFSAVMAGLVGIVGIFVVGL